jgi:hypothetical protein
MARNVSGPRANQSTPSRARWDRHRESAGIGPQLVFAGAIGAGLAAWAVSQAMLPLDAVMPVVSTLLLVLAGAIAVIARLHGWMDPNNVTYHDVAGALTLIGLGAAATIDADQMMRLMQMQSGSAAE